MGSQSRTRLSDLRPYFRAAASDCLGTLSTLHGMAGRYNSSESATARDWYFTSHLCLSRSNGCTLFRGWGLSEVTKLVSPQNSEALWGRRYKLGKAREWWQDASSRNLGSKSLERSNETGPRVTATLQLRGPINHPQGYPPTRTFSFYLLSQQLKFPPRRGTGCGKKKSVREPPVTWQEGAEDLGSLGPPWPRPLDAVAVTPPLRRGVEHEAPPPNGLPSEGQSGQ